MSIVKARIQGYLDGYGSEAIAALVELAIKNSSCSEMLEALAEEYGDELMEHIHSVMNNHPKLKHTDTTKEWVTVGASPDTDWDSVLS